MAESLVSFEMITKPFTEMKEEAERTAERATKYALRQTGRRIIAAARAEVPVYPGPQNQSKYTDDRVVKGLLRRSIHNSKVLDEAGNTFRLKVGPMAPVTRESGKGARGAVLYAQQMERMYGYMSKAVETADLGRIYNDAMAVGLAKFR